MKGSIGRGIMAILYAADEGVYGTWIANIDCR